MLKHGPKLDRKPRLGEERKDIYLLATTPLVMGTFVRSVRRPTYGVKPLRSRRDLPHLKGVTLDRARKGQGVWVRYFGSVPVRVTTLPH